MSEQTAEIEANTTEEARSASRPNILAFVRKPDGTLLEFDELDGIEAAIAADEEATAWIDIERATTEETRRLRKMFKLDPGALEDCLEGEQRPRIDDFDRYIFIVLYGMVGIGTDVDPSPRKLTAFCAKRFLITMPREPLRTIRDVRRRFSKRGEALLSKGTGHVLYQIIDGMVDKYMTVVDDYEDRLDDLEERSAQAVPDNRVLIDVAELRRELLEIYRIASSQRELLMPMVADEYDDLIGSLGSKFSHVRDHLTNVVEVVDTMRELLNGVRDNYHAMIALRTNAVMKGLTLLATVMLPLSLIAGIYGMNLPIWPPPESPWSFWMVMGTMAVVAVGMFSLFKWKRWL